MSADVEAALEPTPDGGERTSGSPLGEGLLVRALDGGVLHAVPPPVAGSLRYTVARLEAKGRPGVHQRLGVTAPHSGDGTSFIARSLAAVRAHDRDMSVCLVDLNWWSREAVDGARPGVADVVDGRAPLADVLLATQNPRLSFLPSGALPLDRRPVVARGQELLHLLSELAFRFDQLVIDLPPLLVTSQSLTLAAHCDGCLMVVRQGVTPVSDLQAAMDLLEGVDVMGVVMNRASSPVPKSIQRRLPTAR